MDVRGIKVLLHAWRSGEEVPGDVEKAHEIAENDPELKAWLDNEAAFDRAFANRLNEVEPPTDLLDKILAAHDDVGKKVVQFPQRRAVLRAETRRSQFIRYSVSVAASFVIIAGIVFFSRHSGSAATDDLEGFVDETVLQALSSSSMRDAGDIAGVIKGLQAGYAPVPGDLPDELDRLQPAKYGVLHTQQGNIGQIGYSDDDSFRLLVLERRCLGGCSSKLTRPVVFDLGDNLAVTWAKGSQVYILVSDRDDEKLIRNVAHTALTSL